MNENNQKIPREIEDYIEKGKQAYKRHNYEYAVELFNHALRLKQDLAEVRHYLHLSNIKNFKENPPSIISKGVRKLKAQTYILNVKKLKSNGRLKQAVSEYEKAISADPLNVNIYIRLAKLFLELDEEKMSMNTFKEILSFDPDNVEALKQLGKLYQKKEEYKQAEEYFEKARDIAPNDADVQKGIKDLAALQTIDKAKWEEQESFRTKVKDIKEARRLEKESKVAKTEKDIDFLIKEVEENLKKDPENTSILFKLADLYSQKDGLNKAQEIYKKILKIQPDNDIAKKNVDNLEIKITSREILKLEQQLKKDPDKQQMQQKLKQLKEKRENIDFESIKERISKLPNDAAARYHYGMLLKSRDKINEAISQFQESVKDPSQRLNSLNMLGLCFVEKRMLDLAVTQFKRALSKAPGITDKTKEIIYNLGTTYEKMGKTEEAVNEFKKIYEVDINYKDIATKIEKVY